MRLIIIRHGETDRNKFGLYTGPVDVSLNETGRTQATRLAKRLRSEQVDIIYTSDLRRAIETADIIHAEHPSAKYVVDPRLRERNAGVFSGRPLAERQAAEKASGLSFRDWKPEGGESLREMKERAGAWFVEHRMSDNARTIAVVSHGLFLATLLEWAVEDGADVEHRDYQHHNAAVTILDIPKVGATRIIHLNDTSHLHS